MSNRLTVFQGNKFTIQTTVTDENSDVVDLTGLTVNLTIYNGKTSIYTDSNTSHTTPASGITTFVITQTETATWPAPSVLIYEIEVVYADGSKFTGTRDYIEFKKDLA